MLQLLRPWCAFRDQTYSMAEWKRVRHTDSLRTATISGAADLARIKVGFGMAQERGNDDLAFRNMFSPEFRNRLDARIRFDPLTPEVMGHIVDKAVKELTAQLAERKVTLSLTPAARDYFAKKGYDVDNGARPLARLVQDEIKRPLADEILFGKLEKGGDVEVDVEDEKVTFHVEASAESVAAVPS